MNKLTPLILLAVIAAFYGGYFAGRVHGIDYATDYMEANLPLLCYVQVGI